MRNGIAQIPYIYSQISIFFARSVANIGCNKSAMVEMLCLPFLYTWITPPRPR